jgi:hypothetical protein
MQLFTQEPPVYLPEKDQKSVLRLGLQPMPASQWMIVDGDFPVFQQHKLAVRRQHANKVYSALAGSEPAQAEFHRLLLEHLLDHHADYFHKQGNLLKFVPNPLAWDLDDQSLWNSSLWVQEDICLMETLNGQYCLTAGSVCSPTNWHLEEKIGKPMDEIHSPVPGYQNKLANRVNRLLDKLTIKKPVLRYNWSVQQDNELYWRDEVDEVSNHADAYWRVERQTLRRLPETGAIVFSIRIYLHSFTKLTKRKSFALDLQSLRSQLPRREKLYKGL